MFLFVSGKFTIWLALLMWSVDVIETSRSRTYFSFYQRLTLSDKEMSLYEFKNLVIKCLSICIAYIFYTI